LKGTRALAIAAVRMLSPMVVVGGTAPAGSVLGGLESGGGAELIVGSDEDYGSRS